MKQAQRHILEAKVAPAPSLRGLPYVALRFKGSSFLIHQIRKMAAVTIARAGGLLTEERFRESLTVAKVNLPIAPPSGLMLRGVQFGHYDKTFGADKTAARGVMALTEAEEAVRDAFCAKRVLPVVGSEENATALRSWLEFLQTYDFLRDGNEQGGPRPKPGEAKAGEAAPAAAAAGQAAPLHN
mmetsp:Transcript_11366/g.26984  ORF Transcript_11366/g.26984 Transcript_11366/m.26984 type:complete len:184 (+) Transcript_11366:638-1189(+)